RGVARWLEKGEPRTVEFETFSAEQTPAFPALPEEFTPMPAGFLRALHEAVVTTAPTRSRYSMTHILLRGQTGEMVASDLKQLLLQSGFPLPWSDDVLVPRLPLFGRRDHAFSGTAELGRTDSHVGLRLGSWTFLLAIDKHGRFPDVATVIPSPKSVTARLNLNSEDVAQLLSLLPEVQGG